MKLLMDTLIGEGYRSPTQLARVISENWARANLYCPACTSDVLTQAPNNTKAFDFVCPSCVARFQLKSSRKWHERRIPDAGYHAMIEAILTDRNPNLLVLNYDIQWVVQNLLVIPSFFFSGSAIEKRKPLGPAARRAGWIGCNILLHSIPSVGRIPIIVDGRVVERGEVRRKYAEAKPLASLDARVRGWTLDVLGIVEALPSEFTLGDVYGHEEQLALSHPRNRNIRAKIRQQLQTLRGMGVIRFLGNGHYSRT